MTPTRRTASWFVAVLAAGALIVPVVPAYALPDGSIVAVFDADTCASSECDPARDPKLSSRAIVSGRIQVRVRSEAQFGLEWVRLEAQRDGSLPACVQFWRTPAGTFSFEQHFTWNTADWPNPPQESGCEDSYLHYHGALARNGSYRLFVTAADRNPDPQAEDQATSSHFAITYRNTPVAPEWLSEPQSIGTPEDPAVRLRWRANPEEQAQPQGDGNEIVEYHVVRSRDGAETVEFAVSVARPESQGCRRVSTFYECIDTELPASGEYRYGILAYRAGGAVACSTVKASCSESAFGEALDVGVEVAATAATSPPIAPTPASSVATDGEASPTATADIPDRVIAPSHRNRQLAAAAPADLPTPLVSIAGLLVVGLAIAHARRIVR